MGKSRAETKIVTGMARLAEMVVEVGHILRDHLGRPAIRVNGTAVGMTPQQGLVQEVTIHAGKMHRVLQEEAIPHLTAHQGNS
jgi:hypothetical protein